MWRPGTEVPILTKHTGNVKGFDLRIRPVCSVSCDLVLFGRDADRHTPKTRVCREWLKIREKCKAGTRRDAFSFLETRE